MPPKRPRKKRRFRQTRPIRRPAGRVLAWGRLYVRPGVVPIIEREAWRLGISNTGLLAEIVEGWARDNAPRKPWRGKVQRVPQESTRGMIRVRIRLPRPLGDRIQAQAARDSTTVRAALRAAIAAGLRHRSAVLAVSRAPRGGPTYSVAFLPLPPAMATEVRELAKKLGVSVNDVVRRAVQAALTRKI